MPDAVEADHLQRIAGRKLRLAEETLPEAQVLGYRERRLHGIEVTEIMAGGCDGRRFATLDSHPAFRARQQACQNSEQRRLAGAVRAGDEKALPLPETEADGGEDAPPVALARQILGAEQHPTPFCVVSGPRLEARGEITPNLSRTLI